MNEEPEAGGPSTDRINELLALYKHGRLEETLAGIDALLLEYPNVPFILHLHGLVHADLGQLDEALASFEETLSLAPDYARAHFSQGTVLDRLGRIQEAVASYTRALEIKPDFAKAYSNLGVDLLVLGKPEAAVASCRKAVHFDPELTEAHNTLGYALDRLKRPEEATACFRRALEIAPDNADAHNNLGNALVHLGREAEAEACYVEAIRARPEFGDAHRNLSMVRSYQEDDPHIAELLELMESETLSARDRMLLCFALGKAHDDIGSPAKAFSYFSDGNRLRKEDLGYDSASTAAKYRGILEAFAGELPALAAESAAAESGPAARPIFIVGMPRSGTSLVEQILASHSQVYGAGELELLEQVCGAMPGDAGPVETEQLRRIREHYLSGIGRLNAAEPFVTDKMPFNFWWLGFIFAALPESLVVHVQRDARATCWSCFRHFFPERGIGFTNDFRDLAAYYKSYADLMAFWRERFPGRIYDLDYETLTENPRDETGRLLEHLGLEWQDACLEFHRTERPVQTISAAQVRQAIYTGSSDEWRRYERHLKPLIELLKDY